MLIWFQKPFLRPPDRFRRVTDPNGTIWTTFGPPAGPARPARAGPEKFFGRGSRGSRTHFFPQRFFFVQKSYSLGPEWVLGPKSSFWTPPDPLKGAILAILCVKWLKCRLWGGLEGSKISFLGPKPTQDPMNIVFEQKNSWGKIFFGTPGTPDRKIFRARAGPAGGPKVVQIVPLGSVTLLKRSGGLKNGFRNQISM